MARTFLCLLTLCFAFCSVRSGRISPEQWPEDVSHVTVASTAASSADDRIDFKDGDDPSIRSHWALLVAGSAGWGNYRHQADVFHAYQVLRAGGYREEHIVVMAYDDIANYPDNPMSGKVFNRPGGPDVYSGVRIDYKGTDVTADTLLSVLEGDSPAVANKGSGRVIDSGPNDKVFLFYSDHGAAGVVGMPSGPFLYADQLMKALRKKLHRRGFREMVMYIEACESGSMFEGLLDDNMAAYVTTAANSYESSWATYCPEFFYGPTADALVPSNSLGSSSSGDAVSGDGISISSSGGGGSSEMLDLEPASLRGWLKILQSIWQWLQHLIHLGTNRTASSHTAPQTSRESSSPGGDYPPQFTTCLGDLYSVSWMEDAEVADLTAETLLQQYNKIKRRTSQNFTYEQGSHVMQYGALDIDREVAGDYEGMLHNGSVPPSPTPSPEWINFAAQQQQQQQQRKQYSSRQLLAWASSSKHHQQMKEGSDRLTPLKGSHQKSMLQRDADLVPLLHTARHSHCPKKRAAAARSLDQITKHRTSVDVTARSAVQQLLEHPTLGYVLTANLGVSVTAVPVAGSDAGPRSPVLLSSSSSSSGSSDVSGDVGRTEVDMLLGYIPGREGRPLVDDWECLRGMVQAWGEQCGQLDQYGMKYTRLFANLCNGQVEPHHLAGVLSSICADQ